jgi:hypothetical protein
LPDDTPSESTKQRERALELVRQFESRSFRVRESASRELLSLGSSALQALEQGSHHPEAEVRERCRELLPRVRQQDLNLRLDAFLQEPTGKSQAKVPGWDIFCQRTGDTPDTRQFYAQMLRRVPNAALLIGKDSQKLANYCSSRQSEITTERERANEDPQPRGSGRKETLSFDAIEIAFWVFVCSLEDVRVELRKEPDQLNSIYLINDIVFQRALANRNQRPLYHKVLLGWMESLKDDADSSELSSAFYFARENDLREALNFAAEYLRKHQNLTDTAAEAMTVIGKFGSLKNVEQLEKFLMKQEECSTINLRQTVYHVQYRDIALAMILRLNKVNLRQAGFEALGNNLELQFFPYYLGFVNDESRLKSFSVYADLLRK